MSRRTEGLAVSKSDEEKGLIRAKNCSGSQRVHSDLKASVEYSLDARNIGVHNWGQAR